MATLRDNLLPVVNSLRGLLPVFGLRRFAVNIRRRIWFGQTTGDGQAQDFNIPIIPAPRVRDITAKDLTPLEAELKAANSGSVAGALYRIDKITPQFTTPSGTTGGYLASQVRLWPVTDTGAIDNLVALVGDDGYLRECVQVTFEQDRAFGYSMVVKELDRPRSPLTGIAIAPNPMTMSISTSPVQQASVTGTHNGGATSNVTTLCAWSTTNAAVATVDIYGVIRAVSVGSAVITAIVLGIDAQTTVNVTA